MQKVRFWDPEHWRFRAEEARTVADQMTHEEAGRSCGALPTTTTVSLRLPRSNSPIRKEERLAIKLRAERCPKNASGPGNSVRASKKCSAQQRRRADRAELITHPLCLTCPGHQWLGPFSVNGSDEQIFGVNERILGRDRSD